MTLSLTKLRKLRERAIHGPVCIESAMSEECDVALGYEMPGEGNPVIIASFHPGDRDDETDGDGCLTHKQARATAKLFVYLINHLDEIETLLHKEQGG